MPHYGVLIDESQQVRYIIEAPSADLAAQAVLSMSRDERMDLEHEVEGDTDALIDTYGPDAES